MIAVAVFALILTLPALKGNKDGVTVAFTAVVSIGVIGLYIAYVDPDLPALAHGRRVRARAVDAGQEVQVDGLVAVLEVLIVVVIYFNLPFSSSGVPWESDFEWSLFNYTPVVTGGAGDRDRDLVAAQRAEQVHGAAAHDRGDRREIGAAAADSRSAVDVRRSRAGWRATRSTVLEPATEAVLAEIPRAGVEEADAAVARAQGGATRPGAAVAPGDRARAAAPLADALEATHEELALLEARNAGKPIGDARGEMGMVVDTFRYYAGAPERLLGDTIPVAGGVGDDVPRAARRRRR